MMNYHGHRNYWLVISQQATSTIIDNHGIWHNIVSLGHPGPYIYHMSFGKYTVFCLYKEKSHGQCL